MAQKVEEALVAQDATSDNEGGDIHPHHAHRHCSSRLKERSLNLARHLSFNSSRSIHMKFDLEAAKEAFQEALDGLQWGLAHDIIDDIEGAGFKKDAAELHKELLIAKREEEI